jgi:hypothetical protein
VVLAAVGHTAVHVESAGVVVLAGAVVEVVLMDVEGDEVGGDDALLPHAIIDTESTIKIPATATRRFTVQSSSESLAFGRAERPDRRHSWPAGFMLPAVSRQVA